MSSVPEDIVHKFKDIEHSFRFVIGYFNYERVIFVIHNDEDYISDDDFTNVVMLVNLLRNVMRESYNIWFLIVIRNIYANGTFRDTIPI